MRLRMVLFRNWLRYLEYCKIAGSKPDCALSFSHFSKWFDAPWFLHINVPRFISTSSGNAIRVGPTRTPPSKLLELPPRPFGTPSWQHRESPT